jgi:hypothetical protein
VIDHALSMKWGTPVDTFDEDARAEYLAQLQDPDHVHAICEEYRAAASIDREHDRADRTAGRRIACPVLVLWSGTGPLASWYIDNGGPLELWRELAPDATGHPVDGGHFFPEEHPGCARTALVRGDASGDGSGMAARVLLGNLEPVVALGMTVVLQEQGFEVIGAEPRPQPLILLAGQLRPRRRSSSTSCTRTRGASPSACAPPRRRPRSSCGRATRT